MLFAGLTPAKEPQPYQATLNGRGSVAAAPDWIAQLTNADPQLRLDAVQRLGAIDLDPREAIPPLVQLLSDPYEAIRDAAADLLRFMGPEVVSTLANAIRSEGPTAGRHDQGVRTQRIAGSILGRLSALREDALEKAVEVASETCRDRSLHEVVRHDVCQSLARLGASQEQARRKAIPVLIDVFQELDTEYLRSDLIFAFEALGPDPAILQVLEQALRGQNVFIRRHAAWALGRFGPAAEASLAALRIALADKDSEVRDSAALAIAQIERTRSGADPRQ